MSIKRPVIGRYKFVGKLNDDYKRDGEIIVDVTCLVEEDSGHGYVVEHPHSKKGQFAMNWFPFTSPVWVQIHHEPSTQIKTGARIAANQIADAIRDGISSEIDVVKLFTAIIEDVFASEHKLVSEADKRAAEAKKHQALKDRVNEAIDGLSKADRDFLLAKKKLDAALAELNIFLVGRQAQ